MPIIFETESPLQTWYDETEKTPIEEQILQVFLERVPAPEREGFLRPSFKEIPSPQNLKDIKEAAALFHQHILENKKILIVGDYDVDGITSTTLFIRFLTKIRYQNFVPFIPNRFDHGYGLTPQTVAEVLKQSPDLVITVDNGITARNEVAQLLQAGVQVIITDHHQIIPEKIPECLVINPKQPECSFPDKDISGVGVAFMFLVALRQQLRETDFWTKAIPEPNLAEDLDLVALGSIADQVPLTGLNRLLTHYGLAQMEKHRVGKVHASYPYLQEFFSQRGNVTIDSEKIGYQMAPLLNAAGRMKDAMEGVNFLLSDTRAKANRLYERLWDLNLERRSTEKKMSEIAFSYAETMAQQHRGIMVFDESFHEGILGIVASRTVEKFGFPAVIFTRAKEGYLKGSCRSTPNVDIVAILKKCESLLLSFGGHPAAAGCSVTEENYPALQERFAQICDTQVPLEENKNVKTDLEILPWMISRNLFKKLRALEPHGQKHPKPIFLIRGVNLPHPRIMGQKHLKWELAPDIEMVFWNAVGQVPETESYNIAFTLSENYFRGKTTLQMNAKAVDKA